jgi:hypothetical protein
VNREYVLNVWAPPGAPWSAWAKPVLFAHVDPLAVTEEIVLPEASETTWMPEPDGSTALVLDLPGTAAVAMGLAAARKGFRPVPLYNALPSAGPVISHAGGAACDIWPIIQAISAATADLDKLNLPYEAPPAFLLDATRRVGAGMTLTPGMFDNRSVSLPTDFPSVNRMLAMGINRAVLVQRHSPSPQEDLSHTLLRWQQGGITIEAVLVEEHTGPIPIVVRRPPMYRILWQRLLATAGLRRNPLGGFGGVLPIPSASG